MILVTGATGNVGGYLVRQLCAAGAPVRALARTPEKAEALRGYDCDVAIGNFGDPDSLDHALRRVTKVFLSSPSGADQPELEGNVIAAIRRAATAPHVVKLGAIGCDTDTSLTLIGVHTRVVEQLRAEGLPHTVLAPNNYMQNLLLQAAAVQQAGSIFYPAGAARIAHVDAVDVAAVAAHVLTTDGHEGQTYTITGPESLTYDEVAARLATVLGRDVGYVDVPAEQARESMLASGLSPWLADALVEVNAAYTAGFADTVTDEVEKAAGRPARTVDAFFDDHRAAFG